VTDQGERYDRIAEGYARWWAPVLAPAVAELLDEMGPGLGGAHHVIDIGTGTGQLALAALERWPGITVVGIDASAEMRAMADAEADRRLSAGGRARFSSIVALADRMPVADGSFDTAVSSFVFQLVPNRSRALREARRVLRPGGRLAYVSWLDGDPVGAFLPDVIFDEVLDELDFDEPDGDERTGDIPSVERAAAELRRAGFADVTARAGTLAHRYTVDGYVGFLTEFDEESMFAELDPALRDRVVTTLRARLAPLTAEQLTMRAHIVFATGRRSR
jgi:ubiquinone/menaquinone biosynthesis C-methylase UbiE